MRLHVELDNNINQNERDSLWIFGYGSLCWRPGFDFDKAVTGHVKGFTRKFWQGNSVHRGTSEKPGRVATLIEDDDNLSSVYGIAFAISGETALPYLSQRECKLGGYDVRFTTFYPTEGEPIKNILLYIATPTNSLWLGDAPLPTLASEIIATKGQCGHNVEYILRLALFMRDHFPNIHDSHLFDLENEIVEIAQKEKLSIISLMGDGNGCVTFIKTVSSQISVLPRRNSEHTNNFQFTATLPSKALRCLNI